jgi:predicted transposase YbfD/YdcC
MYFEKHLELDLQELTYRCHETSESAHGRIDERSYFLTRIPPDFALKNEWPWIKAIGYSLRVTQQADGSETDETRYYILSRYLSGKRFSEAVRGHWTIESMHWVLDVTFREDDSRTRERTLAQVARLVVGRPRFPRESWPVGRRVFTTKRGRRSIVQVASSPGMPGSAPARPWAGRPGGEPASSHQSSPTGCHR